MEKAREEVHIRRGSIDGRPGPSSEAANPALAYRIGGDVRAGLGELRPDLGSFDGWMGLQRLEALYCKGVSRAVHTIDLREENQADLHDDTQLCHRPNPLRSLFFESNEDGTIASFLGTLTTDEGACGRHDCEAGEEGHTRWWIHGGKQVGMRVQMIDSGGNGLDVWVQCDACGQRTEPNKISEVATASSWENCSNC